MNALMTDKYELTMLDALIKEGRHTRKATFEVFARSLPKGRRYGVFAGLSRLLPMIEKFKFDPEALLFVQDMISLEALAYLAKFKFTGTITAYREGELYFPNSPVLTVEGTLGECILLETLILSVLNFDSAIATTAARMVSSANGRNLIEMGSRRTHEEAAVAAARAAYIAGFSATSNMLAGHRYGIPVTGTAAHAFTLAHDSEYDAFAAQIDAQGVGTTLLVDTYDIEQGIENAYHAAYHFDATGPGAIRIDSGDLAIESVKARAQLDSHGAYDTKIVVSGDMDEFTMKALKDSPIDGYGVGTKLVSSTPAGFVYKLVEIETEYDTMRPVAKKSKDKASVGGKKVAYRILSGVDVAIREVYSTDPYFLGVTDNARKLQYVAMHDGEWLPPTMEYDGLEATRAFHASVKAELPASEQTVWYGENYEPYLTAEHIS